jgi:hypothetical protein
MPIEEFRPNFLTEQQSKEIATRQVLSFLFIPETEPPDSRKRRDRAPSKALFAFRKIPEDGFIDARQILNWQSRPVYDVDNLLLFRDQTIRLNDGINSLHVRVTHNDLLRTPVWMVRAGKTWDIDDLIDRVISVIQAKPDLEPELRDGEKRPRLICYGYPKLGVLCASHSRPERRFIVDLWDLTFIPLKPEERGELQNGSEPLTEGGAPESVTIIWSPYDMVTRGTVDHFRSLWNHNVTSLPPLPASRQNLPGAIAMARNTIVEELTTNPELILEGQQTNVFCAPATARMILRNHNIDRTQGQIATTMGTTPDGTLPQSQANAIEVLTRNTFLGSLDVTTSFSEAKDEVRDNRPFKTGGIAHARACGGFKVDGDGKEWLYIYDPLPANQGDTYFENWLADYHCNYMYVRPNSNI